MSVISITMPHNIWQSMFCYCSIAKVQTGSLAVCGIRGGRRWVHCHMSISWSVGGETNPIWHSRSTRSLKVHSACDRNNADEARMSSSLWLGDSEPSCNTVGHSLSEECGQGLPNILPYRGWLRHGMSSNSASCRVGREGVHGVDSVILHSPVSQQDESKAPFQRAPFRSLLQMPHLFESSE